MDVEKAGLQAAVRMATLELTIKYQTTASKIAYWLMLLSSPFWCIIPVIVLLMAFSARVFAGNSAYFFEAMCALPLLITSWAMFAAISDRKLVISQHGICFPSTFLPGLLLRRNRSWYDLRTMSLSGHGGEQEKVMHLSFRSGGSANINLRSLPPEAIEQLILGIETFAPPEVAAEKLEPLKSEIVDQLKIKGIKSYTNIWKDELSYRYSATTFIPLAPGKGLLNGELRVVRQLGFGGLSAVYLVQRAKKDLFILKESALPADVEDALREKAAEHFQRECLILAKLDHPRIAKVFDHFVEDGRHYLLLEYVHGEDLRQLVQEKGPLPEAQVKELAIEIAQIIDYLHSQTPPILHRDITPENLVLNDKGKVVLIDFGAANNFLQTATGTLVGKHCYIAPEQFRGKATLRSDYFSFGGTLHYLLTGTDPTPLSSSSPAQTIQKVSPEMDELVQSLTQMDANKRPENVQTILKLLQHGSTSVVS